MPSDLDKLAAYNAVRDFGGIGTYLDSDPNGCHVTFVKNDNLQASYEGWGKTYMEAVADGIERGPTIVPSDAIINAAAGEVVG